MHLDTAGDAPTLARHTHQLDSVRCTAVLRGKTIAQLEDARAAREARARRIVALKGGCNIVAELVLIGKPCVERCVALLRGVARTEADTVRICRVKVIDLARRELRRIAALMREEVLRIRLNRISVLQLLLLSDTEMSGVVGAAAVVRRMRIVDGAGIVALYAADADTALNVRTVFALRLCHNAHTEIVHVAFPYSTNGP